MINTMRASEKSYVWVKMDGIVNPLAKVRFLKVYEKIKE